MANRILSIQLPLSFRGYVKQIKLNKINKILPCSKPKMNKIHNLVMAAK